MESWKRGCWDRADCCFISAWMHAEKCELCGLDAGGAVKAKVRGTEEDKLLCAACFWESRVDQAMPLCPCADNARVIKVHHRHRALMRARQ